MGKLLTYCQTERAPVVALGYGAFGLVPGVYEQPKDWPFRGRNVTGVSMQSQFEQNWVGDFKVMLQERVEELGGNFVDMAPSSTSMVVDGHIITGPSALATRACVQRLVDMFGP